MCLFWWRRLSPGQGLLRKIWRYGFEAIIDVLAEKKLVTLEVFLKSVEGVQVDQSIWGRMLNFGTIIVSGTGGVNDP